MKKSWELLVAAIVLVMLTACGNSAEDTGKSQNNSISKTSDEVSTVDVSESENDKVDSIASGDNNQNVKNSSNHSSETKESSSTPNSMSVKEEYLKKLRDAENDVEAIRENPKDGTTFALKEVEGKVYDILDGLLNEIYGVLKEQLSSEEMEQLRKEQREWLTYRDNSAKEASLKFEGGTMEQLEYVTVQNNLTKERCFELVEMYMK